MHHYTQQLSWNVEMCDPKRHTVQSLRWPSRYMLFASLAVGPDPPPLAMSMVCMSLLSGCRIC